MGRTYKELFDKIVDRLIDHAYLNQDVFGHRCPHSFPRSAFHPLRLEDCQECDDNDCKHNRSNMSRVTPNTLLLRG
jgi:hypothetical protein